MNVSGVTTQNVGSQAPAGRALKPVAEIRDELPARQDRERAARYPLRDSGVLVERLRTGVGSGRDIPRIEGLVSYRAFQAVSAYTALERSQEREYVSTVLGVDEYA